MSWPNTCMKRKTITGSEFMKILQDKEGAAK